MHICARAAWLEDHKLATVWALTHAFARPVVVTHDLAGAKE
jgi:hypothetical protein